MQSKSVEAAQCSLSRGVFPSSALLRPIRLAPCCEAWLQHLLQRVASFATSPHGTEMMHKLRSELDWAQASTLMLIPPEDRPSNWLKAATFDLERSALESPSFSNHR